MSSSECDFQSAPSDEDQHCYMHGHLACVTSDALFRALAPMAEEPRAGNHGYTSACVATQLALSHERRNRIRQKRNSVLLSVQETLAREYLVAKRLAASRPQKRSWAVEWATNQHADQIQDSSGVRGTLRRVR